MRRWVMLLPLLLGLGSVAWATTWTCTKDFQAVQEGYYEVVGTCTPSGAYTVGGDALGASASAKDTAQAVCHTNNQTLVDLILSPSSDGAATSGATLTFDAGNRLTGVGTTLTCGYRGQPARVEAGRHDEHVLRVRRRDAPAGDG